MSRIQVGLKSGIIGTNESGRAELSTYSVGSIWEGFADEFGLVVKLKRASVTRCANSLIFDPLFRQLVGERSTELRTIKVNIRSVQIIQASHSVGWNQNNIGPGRNPSLHSTDRIAIFSWQVVSKN